MGKKIKKSKDDLLAMGGLFMGGLGNAASGHFIASQLKECLRVKIAWDIYNDEELVLTMEDAFAWADRFIAAGKTKPTDEEE